MVAWVGVGFVVVLSLMGLIDGRHARRTLAKALGAFSIVAAALAAGGAAWVTLTGGALDVTVVPILCAGPVLGGLVADVLGELRTRAFPATATVTLFAQLLPGASTAPASGASSSAEPTLGAVLFLAVICVMLGAIAGALLRKLARVLMYRDRGEDDGSSSNDG